MDIDRSLEIRADAVARICLELKRLLADVFVLYLKTRTFIGICEVRIFTIITCSWTNMLTSSLR